MASRSVRSTFYCLWRYTAPRAFARSWCQRPLVLATSNSWAAWRGVYDNLGECDLLVLIRDASGQRVAIMVEDKIDASFQPSQASRYRQRGERGRALERWDRFITCLCAPKAYAEPIGKEDAWDAILTYEEIEARLAAQEDTFAPFVSGALRQAADKQRSGGFVASRLASAFWAQYRRLQREEFPGLKMTPPRRGPVGKRPLATFCCRDATATCQAGAQTLEGLRRSNVPGPQVRGPLVATGWAAACELGDVSDCPVLGSTSRWYHRSKPQSPLSLR